jgi:hypothetical protein
MNYKYHKNVNMVKNMFNIMSMEEVPHQISWWDSNILPTIVGGYFLTRVEQKTPNEFVRKWQEVVNPSSTLSMIGIMIYTYLCIPRAAPLKGGKKICPKK